MTAKPLNQLSGMPQLGAAFAGWAQKITLTKRVQIVVNGLTTYGTPQTITFNGVIQPLSPESIALKPEGQRSWQWLQIHCLNGTLGLSTDDQIVYNGVIYKVMAVLDYSLNGYVEYHVIKDFQP